MHFFHSRSSSSNPSHSQPNVGYGQWRSQYLRAAGNSYYVDYNQKKEADVKNAITVSEAHGYGMLLAVYHDSREDFDGFCRYFDLFRNSKGLMGWQQILDRKQHIVPAPDGGENSATDGDIDIAHALFLASDKWPTCADGRPSDYFARAIDLCRAIYHYNINQDLWSLTLGDWVDKHDKKFWNITRPSDFILSAIHVFAMRDTERSAGWEQLRNSIISTALCLHAENRTGLLPDFAVYKHGKWTAVHGQVLESGHDGDFHYNACRTPWRLAAYLKSTGDQRVLPILQAMAKFFDTQKEISAGYKLNGKSYVDYTDKCFTAPAWMCLHVLGSPNAGRIWSTLADDECSYFGDSIQALCEAQARC
ncbi:cellulase [Powellomyces hirtus]|uniref:Cellulase n=1 Tax=Powellomyces hirtus TaxID=109895 RepID=A0A507E0B6_9FUNG|nr:Six-hairpin glycosidase-like protein [Powellomyces hirtus]TPX57519.1 cellulase [Powellomyces hirtus]